MKNDKRETMEGIEQSNMESEDLGEKENYKYLRILDADTIK